MRKTDKTLELVGEKQNQSQPLTRRLWLLLPTVPILLGLWGMGQKICPSGSPWLLVSLGAAAFALCFQWESKGFRWALPALWAAALGACLLLREPLSEGLAALGSGIRTMLTEKTGYYYLPYENAAWNHASAAFAALLLGGITGIMMRRMEGHLVCTGLILVFSLFFPETVSLWLGLYLGGTVLLLAQRISGPRSMLAGLVLMAVIAAPFGQLQGGLPQTAAGQWISAAAHGLRYESEENPLPEGKLRNLGAFRPSQAVALELQMEQWRGTYIRGFVGGTYGDQGWASIAPDAEEYRLHKNGFYPTAQRGEAEAALGNRGTNSVTLKNWGACRAYAYVPYGAGDFETDPRQLRTEGGIPDGELQGSLFDVSDSYLVQAALGENTPNQTYIDAEGAYREAVYANYLDVPEKAYATLSEFFPLPEEALSTTQARQQVLSWVESTLTYDENADFQGKSQSLLEYLLSVNPRGYSVQYATLATLLLRCCGVPARYVEGYLLTEEEAQTMAPGATAYLTQKNAHAWAEFYLDGVGWLPFDTTPIHADEVTYRLPPDGSGQDGTWSQRGTLNRQQEGQNIPIRQDAREKEGGDWTWLPWALLALALLGLGALGLRAALLRRKLKKHLSGLSAQEPTKACLEYLRYTEVLLDSLGLSRENRPLTQRKDEISRLLGLPPEQVEQALAFASRLRFSGHPATEEDRKLALGLMQRVEEIWKEKTKPMGRIYFRWVRCTIR